MVMPMAAGRRAIPWWGVPLNWLVGMFQAHAERLVVVLTRFIF
jgi:hypothetical protein